MKGSEKNICSDLFSQPVELRRVGRVLGRSRVVLEGVSLMHLKHVQMGNLENTVITSQLIKVTHLIKMRQNVERERYHKGPTNQRKSAFTDQNLSFDGLGFQRTPCEMSTFGNSKTEKTQSMFLLRIPMKNNDFCMATRQRKLMENSLSRLSLEL